MPPMIKQTNEQNFRRKILLVTLYALDNYGNVLQRCALTSVLEAFGFETEHLCASVSIRFYPKTKRYIKNIIKRILALLGVREYRELLRIQRIEEPRSKRFQSFQDKPRAEKYS